MNRKTYLGDSVYAQMATGTIVLTTENGPRPSNTIYLEPQVYEALVKFVQSSINESVADRMRRLNLLEDPQYEGA